MDDRPQGMGRCRSAAPRTETWESAARREGRVVYYDDETAIVEPELPKGRKPKRCTNQGHEDRQAKAQVYALRATNEHAAPKVSPTETPFPVVARSPQIYLQGPITVPW